MSRKKYIFYPVETISTPTPVSIPKKKRFGLDKLQSMKDGTYVPPPKTPKSDTIPKTSKSTSISTSKKSRH